MAGLGPARGDDPVLARVGSHDIRQSYVYTKIESLPLGEQLPYREDLGRFVASVVREELLFQYALGHALNEDHELREAVKAQVVEILIDRQVRSRAKVGEGEARALYRASPDDVRGEHWRVTHIPLAARSDCEALMPTLINDEARDRAARTRGTDAALASRGGDLGYFMRHHNVLGLGQLLFELPVNQPFMFENETGCHIVWVSEHVDPPMPAFEAVKPKLEAFLRGKAEAALLHRLVERAAATIPVTAVDLSPPR